MFCFNSNLDRTFCKQTVETYSVVSVLGQHCSHMSNKKDVRLTWIDFSYMEKPPNGYFYQQRRPR